MLNFRNVVVGSGAECSKNHPEQWPKLGENPKQKKLVRPKNVNQSKKTEFVPPAKNSQPPSEKLSTTEFPTLCYKPATEPIRAAPEDHLKDGKIESVRKPNRDRKTTLPIKKKKIKRSAPLLVDICDIIQMTALKAQRKSETPLVKKSSKIKRKIITGNRLDGEAPRIIHKGKIREWRPRFMSKTKKTFCASWKIHRKRIPFSPEMLKFKENLGTALKCETVDVDKLVDGLSTVKIVDCVEVNEVEESNNKKNPAIYIAKDVIHNSKFRPYCTNIVTADLKDNVSRLVETLRKFQDRAHAKDEIKARMRKRYVCGFRESKKFVVADRVKLLLVATNLEIEEGLPSMAILKSLTDAAEEKAVPIVYAGLAQNIARWSMKKGKTSVLAVMNYEGADDCFQNVMKSWARAKSDYEDMLDQLINIYSAGTCSKIEEAIKTTEEGVVEVLFEKLKKCVAEDCGTSGATE